MKKYYNGRKSANRKTFISRRIIALLVGILVAFTTTYTLILPAITVDLDTAEDMNGLVLDGTVSEEPVGTAAVEETVTGAESAVPEAVAADTAEADPVDTYTEWEEPAPDNTNTPAGDTSSEEPAAEDPMPAAGNEGSETTDVIETDLPAADTDIIDEADGLDGSANSVDEETAALTDESSADTILNDDEITTDPSQDGTYTDTEAEASNEGGTPADGENPASGSSVAETPSEENGSEETIAEEETSEEENSEESASGDENAEEETSEEETSEEETSEEETSEEETTEEDQPVVSPLTYHCDYYEIEVSFDSSVQLPAGTKLKVRELYEENLPYYEDLEYEDLLIYQHYFELSEEAMKELRVEELSTSVLYELSFVDKDGKDVLLPYIDYDIQVKYLNPVDSHEDEVIRTALYAYDAVLNEYRADLVEQNDNPEQSLVAVVDEYHLLQELDLEKVSFYTYDIVIGLFAGKEAEEETDETEELTEMTFNAVLDNVSVDVIAPDGAFPEGTTMVVKPVEEQDVLDVVQSAVDSQVKSVTAVDITFYDADGNEIQPEKEIQVSIKADVLQEPEEPVLVHVDHEGEANVVEDVTHEEEGLSFESKEFSVYVLVYTVDFEYEINGQTYSFSIPGGGFVSLNHLVEVLGIAADAVNSAAGTDSSTEDTTEESAAEGLSAEDTGAVDASAESTVSEGETVYDSAIDLNNTAVSETTAKFAAEIAGVTFSNSEYVWVGKVEADTTIGALKEAYALNVQYSTELTPDEIAEINAQTVSAGDWVLISLLPFTSEETLTVTMNNGDSFVVKVTDAQEISTTGFTDTQIDSSLNCIICYEETIGSNTVYHVLKTDGTTETKTLSEFDALGSEYQWNFYYVFKEKDREYSIDNVYYFVRPTANKSYTLALNTTGENLIQSGTNNIAVHPQDEGGFIFEGYNGTGGNGIKLLYTSDQFSASNSSSSVIKIYQQDPLEQYSFTVATDDSSMGIVSGTDENGNTISNAESYISITDSEKKNKYAITATPVAHADTAGNNKWVFDYWDLNGTELSNTDYPATISAGSLEIPYNSSVLTAHFIQNPSYIVPDNEKQGSTVEDMSTWLSELTSRNIPLNAEECKKTAEVYDYENRIYRVDLTAQSNLTTFSGTIDLGFMLDVSASMLFPSKLESVETDFNIYSINNNYNTKRSLEQNQTYYLIGDETNTATVFRLFYNKNIKNINDNNWYWYAIDASKYDTDNDTSAASSDSFRIGIDSYKTAWLGYAGQYPFTSGDNVNSSYTIYQDGDAGKQRIYYLENSMSKTITNLNSILGALAVGTENNPDVKIAYNTFCKTVNYWNLLFNSASDFDASAFNNLSTDGGTHTDWALADDLSNTGDHSANKFDWENSATKYAILITDGAPQSGGKAITNEQVINAANTLKSNGVKLITVGLSMGNVERGRILLYELADSIDGEKLFFSAESGDELENVLLKIIQTLMVDATVRGNVTDTINEAFYPVDKSTGKTLSAGDMIDLNGNLTNDTNQPHGTITYNSETGLYGVTWSGQEFTWDGWQGTVYVKAKEDLLGGNGVLTNSGNAVIEAKQYSTDGENWINLNTESESESEKLKTRTISLESPRVNVNELAFTGNDTEWTVYLGTEVDPKEQLKKLWENINIQEVVTAASDVNEDGLPDKITDSNHYYPLQESITDDRESAGSGTKVTFTMNALLTVLAKGKNYSWWNYNDNVPNWDEFLKNALTETGIVIPYDAYSLTDNDNSTITIKLTKEILEGEQADLINQSPHATTVVNDTDSNGNDVPVEKYTLEVKYSPDYTVLPVGQGGSSSVSNDDYHVGTYGTMYQGHAAGTETSTNTHVINVYAEPLDVFKIDNYQLAVPGVEFKLYREANMLNETEAEAVESLSSYDATLTGNYYCISTATSGKDGIIHLAPDGNTHKAPVSNRQTSQNLLVPGVTYYLVESSVPAGYEKDGLVRTVTVVTGPDLYTKIDKVTTVEQANIDTSTNKPKIAYNWNQGVTILIGEIGSDSDPVPAEIVNHTTQTTVTLIDVTDNSKTRTYLLRSDTDNLIPVVYRTTIVNNLITDITIQKTDTSGTGLSGAVFQLKSVGDSGEADVTGVTGLGTVTKEVDGETNTYTSAFETNGNVQTLSGLKDGTYRLYEVYIPAGYISTLRYIEFKIDRHEMTVITEDSSLEFTAAGDNRLALLKIKNTPGVALPSTGGSGPWPFFLFGGILTAAAGILFALKYMKHTA